MILLRSSDPFPSTDLARQDMNGLLAVGADLSPQRLLDAYSQGIFPWGTLKGLPLWHCPNPRMVLFPQALKIRRSLAKTLRHSHYTVRLDNNFAQTIAACADMPRAGQDGTWITPDMESAYLRLHELGWAHSVETWMHGELAGGLYGIAIGRMFFGESMFSRRTDASKIALAHLCRFLSERGFGMIDCQMHTPHLASLGAQAIDAKEFRRRLSELIPASAQPGLWPVDAAHCNWN